MKKKELNQIIGNLEEILFQTDDELRNKQQLYQRLAEVLLENYKQHMLLLDPSCTYDLLERLTSGQEILHLTDVSVSELQKYVVMTYIYSKPPQYIFRIANVPQIKPAKENWLKKFLRKVTSTTSSRTDSEPLLLS